MPVSREKAVLVSVTFDVKAHVVNISSVSPLAFVVVVCDEKAMGSVPIDLSSA
jgi:hypothetical protein